MGTQELTASVEMYLEYKRLAEEAQEIADNIASQLKAVLVERGESRMSVGSHCISFVDCSRTDVDRKRLEAEKSEIYKEYLKLTTYKRFQVS